LYRYRAALDNGHIGSVSCPPLKIANFLSKGRYALLVLYIANDIGKAWVVVYFGRVFGDTSKA
jgi:hypothetical protein